MLDVRSREPVDHRLLFVTVFLLLVGLAIVLDASFARAMQSRATGGDPYFFFKRQAVWAAVALGVLVASMKVPYWTLKRLAVPGIVICAALLVIVLVPGIGLERNGSRRWLGLGMLNFQPSEFAKIGLVLFLARFSEVWRGNIQHFWKGFLPPVIAVLGIGALVAKEDLGTAITVVGTGLLLVYMMGARRRHLAGLVLAALGMGAGYILLEPYRLERIYAWLDLLIQPLHPHQGNAYQPSQGLIALGSGGWTGVGFGHGGMAKHLYLPAEHTDYIFATVGEELGLVGCMGLVVLFGYLVVRGLTVAHRTRDWFGCLVAAGLTSMIGIQALVNISVVSGLVPCTGVPLPFISYGGSSLLFTTLALGIVLNISQYPQAPGPRTPTREPRESRVDGWRNRGPHLSGD